MDATLFLTMNDMIQAEDWDYLRLALEDEIETDEDFQKLMEFMILSEDASLPTIKADMITTLSQAYLSSIDQLDDELTSNEALLILHTTVQNVQVVQS